MTHEKMPEALRLAGRMEWYCISHTIDTEMKDAAKELRRQHAEIERLRVEVMKANANLFEVRKLLDERPAMNQGLVVEYQKWTGKVYSLDFMNAQDAAIQSTKEQP
jgi:hypothetical protein